MVETLLDFRINTECHDCEEALKKFKANKKSWKNGSHYRIVITLARDINHKKWHIRNSSLEGDRKL
jgi:hypothetical protein